MKPSEYKQMMNYLTRPKKDTIRLPVTKYDTQILDPIKTPPTKMEKHIIDTVLNMMTLKQKIKLFSMIQSQDYSQIKINLLLIKMQIQLVFIMTYTKNMYPIFKRKKSSLDLRKKN